MILGEEKMKTENFDEKDLRATIICTVAFFDLFDYPMTEIEIWERLEISCEFEEFLRALKSLEKIESGNGFYFLKGRREILKRRDEQYILSQEKWKIAKRAGYVLRFLSGVRMVAVCNNFSYKKDSDVDVFIVTQKNRIWLTRFLVTFGMHLFGFRRHGKKITNRICLSFYVSEEGMDLEGLLIGDEKNELSGETGLIRSAHNDKFKRDPYFVFWMVDLLPIYDDGVMDDFWEANSWLKKVLPNCSLVRVSQRIRVGDNVFSKIIKGIYGMFLIGLVGNFFEDFTKKIQQKKMSKNFYSLSKENDSRVVISDTVLKFHEEDRREFYRKKWLDRISVVKS